MLVEIELYLLIGDVYTELLKGVDGEVLKTEDVEDGD